MGLEKIVEKAIEQTVAEYKKSCPAIYQHFFYGAVDIAPQLLVVWYLFETDEDLQVARASGLCNRLTETTIHNLMNAGYPAEAFSEEYFSPEDQIAVQNGVDWLAPKKAQVVFTTKEDIDQKAHGDYWAYFK